MTEKDKESDHWLVRPVTIRMAWILGLLVLALTVVADRFVKHKSYFGIDGTFGFSAWFSFAACIALVIIAKVIGAFLKRSDTYYDR